MRKVLLKRILTGGLMLVVALLLPACQSTGAGSPQAGRGFQDPMDLTRGADRDIRMTVYTGEDAFLADR
ncbi:MAG TPA: hypothetical protein PKG54_20060 [Phycisphaerae bacterium]|nr:hypothetical protein [Phycisphaerae bacterium]HOB76813.1 hypothetical protein [Phycisphaerae bacterium]HOJ56840.1 hypothetical protein [Phycisphaerae bacterium]HOL28560.1 hypothetical protein [Phycisphaerae bacterium]HPP23083.1 hypothetical protein [Phycisphaerae bacterium]